MNETREVYAYMSWLKHAGKLWYIVNPYDTTFQFVEDVPDYHKQIWLSFFVLIAMESIILYTNKEKRFRLNDHVTSLSHWILQETGRVFFRGIEYYSYILIYEKYRIWSLAWDSPWTWYITAIAVDFCYYWVHRANHEVHILWAQHQVHHSSEEFNLAVGLRQSVLQQWCSFMFYLPLAFFIPPSHFITHHQLNLIYQLWIHTTVIKDLGPFEFVFNTPKHHRVHHGCNLYCLDKNYGGMLIIWDRIFGTFMEELPKPDIIYGLVVSPQSFNPIYLQTFYTKAMLIRSIKMKSLQDKLAVMWKGPSWLPGLPRLGLDKFKVNVKSRINYNTCIPKWQKLYIIIHFSLVLNFHTQIYDESTNVDILQSTNLIINNLWSVTSIGLLFDKYKYGSIVELTRCIVYLIYFRNISIFFSNLFFFYIFFGSCCIWILYIIRNYKLIFKN
ncbi:alkylglycerol monooxygenase-like isoform X1 [Leptopilina boulardi]|uniref:alkylglycerol monooxygenase-like isoform X1 n=1 Tax=Leptopilina boulardi TaxID=63433 RepID=UPI0021F53CA5|nr:alkylglycerol monooxygenase-like isoform X1 [Leptopilina boulardi]